MSPANLDTPPSPSQHPDLSNEVATLSNKLINAINHQTNLDDTLSATRHELETSQERVRQLELENKNHADLVARGVLIRSTTVQAQKEKLLAMVTEKEKQRAEAEAERKKMELDLEGLTAELFEEANKVILYSGFPWIFTTDLLTNPDGDICSRSSQERSRCCATEKRPAEGSARRY
jgi:hypothetical protein